VALMASNQTPGGQPPVRRREKFSAWLLEGQAKPATNLDGLEEVQATQHHQTHPWWKVMCLTGVDYFSTLGYQPGIAALQAGVLAPLATLVLVLVTLFGALPMYRRVAEESPHGDGSISMLERLLAYWPSKLLVLALIGFVATGFIITITLSAADASAHVIENPLVHNFVKDAQVPITLLFIALLGAVFLKGFSEAVGIAVVLVVLYIGLSLVVVGVGIQHVLQEPIKITNWLNALSSQFTSPLAMIGAVLLVFPKLALGLSGFETGVVVMPLVKGAPGDTEENPKGRIRNAQKLLLSAALIMSVMLILSAFVTTVLIPRHEYWPEIKISQEVNADTWRFGTATVSVPLDDAKKPKQKYDWTIPTNLVTSGEKTTIPVEYKGDKFNLHVSGKLEGNKLHLEIEKDKGEANGRALAYIAHEFLGDAFGTIYDIATILILWFAGSSAMAGLLNIVPRYLPRYGMGPDWTRATRPLTLIFTLICFIVTFAFRASVDAQAAAYATGVLALMTSAAIAVTLSAIRKHQNLLAFWFGLTSAIFVYTTAVTVFESPDGLQIASFFIAGILIISIISRVTRSFELRITEIRLDESADAFLAENVHHSGELHIIANKRQAGDWGEYQDKELAEREDHHISQDDPIIFFEVEVSDASEFVGKLQVRGVEVESPNGQKYHILRATAPAIPNAIAAFLLYVRNRTSLIPHCYFTWSEITPIANVTRFLFFGEGDTAPMTREIIRQNEPKPRRRPRVHVG
jgi:hypothetical protein